MTTAKVSGSGKYDGEYFVDTAMTLGFPPLTPADIARLEERDRQEMLRGVVVEMAVKAKALARTARRTRLRLQALASGGFTFQTPDVFTFHIQHAYDSKRAELRRAKFGRQ